MALNLDVSKLTQSAATKPTAHDNCTVIDLGTGAFPRDIEVRLPDDDGARQNALWDGSLNLAVNDEVLCFEYSGISAWRVMAMGGNDGGAGKVRVSEVWESDFGDVALETDADGNIGIGTAGPDAKFDVLATAGAQLRLTFEDEVKFADFTLDTNHHLTIDPSSTGQIKLNATVTVIDEVQREGDADTKIGFMDDQVGIFAGGIEMFRATTFGDMLHLGDVGGGGDVDISFNDGQMFLQGSNGALGIGGVPTLKLDLLPVTANARLGNMEVGAWPASTAFAYVGHENLNHSAVGNYALLQSNVGQTVINSATGEDISFRENNVDKMTLSGGNLGLGITNPTRDIHVKRSDASGVGLTVELDNTSTATNSFSALTFKGNNSNVIVSFFADGLGSIVSGGGGVFRTFSNHPLAFGTNATEAMRIDINQRVGIGVTVPLAKGHIDQSSTTAAIPVLTLDQADLSEEFINFISTIGAGNPIDTAAIGTYYGKARIAVNGTFKYIALYNP